MNTKSYISKLVGMRFYCVDKHRIQLLPETVNISISTARHAIILFPEVILSCYSGNDFNEFHLL